MTLIMRVFLFRITPLETLREKLFRITARAQQRMKEKENNMSKQNAKLSDLCKALQKERSKLSKETASLKGRVAQLEKQIEK